MGMHPSHNDNLNHAMNVYIRRPFKNSKDQKKAADATKYITLKDGLSRPGNFINGDSMVNNKSLIKNKSQDRSNMSPTNGGDGGLKKSQSPPVILGQPYITKIPRI